jgi:hypothetical protein
VRVPSHFKRSLPLGNTDLPVVVKDTKHTEISEDDVETFISLTGLGVQSVSKKRCDNKVLGATPHPEDTGD